MDEDYIEIVLLPTDVVPVSKPSKRIERLLTKREQSHNSILNFIQKKIQKINAHIKDEIWEEAKSVKKRLGILEDEITKELEGGVRLPDDELLSLDGNAFEAIKKLLYSHEEKCCAIIDRFYENLTLLEKKRSDLFKTVLKENYKNLQTVFFKLPRDLLYLFDDEITKINQITINNYYYYSQLRTDLKLQVEEYVRTWLLELLAMEDRRKLVLKKVKIRSKIDVKAISHGDEEELKVTKFDETQGVSSITGVPLTASEMEMWSKHIQETLEFLDFNSKKLVSLYKMAVGNIFNRFFHQLKQVTESLLEEKEETTTAYGDAFDDSIDTEVYKPVVEEITEQYECEIADLQKMWNSATSYMESNIKNTYLFLEGASHLWDSHFARIAEVRTLILQDLNHLIDKNDKAAQGFEKKINTIVDKLRQEATVPKLNRYLADTNRVLDSIGKLYSKQCEAEIKILGKYRRLVDKEVEVLLAEIERFLGEFSESDSLKAARSALTSGGSAEEINEHLIPHQMKTCKYQVDAVNNWMFGLWETINSYTKTCRKEVAEQAKAWVDNQAVKLRKRLEVRMAAHKPRYTRVKVIIYDARLKELEDHRKLIESLEADIQKVVDEGRKLGQACKQGSQDDLKNLNTQIKKIDNKSKNATNSLQIESLIKQLGVIFEEAKIELENKFEDNSKILTDKLKTAQQLISSVSSAIKLFSQGGNYGKAEIKTTIKKLKKLSSNAPKKSSKVLEEFKSGKSEILRKFEELKMNSKRKFELSLKEFQHNEKAVKRIEKLQRDIRNKAYDVKFTMGRLDACIDCFACLSQMNLWKKKNFDLMKKMLLECLETITEMAKYLMKETKMKNENRVFSYILDLDAMITNCYSEIEADARVFYRGHGAIINKDKIQPTYESFMEEVRKTLDCYRRQTKIHCLECAEDLIALILKLFKVNDHVYEGLSLKYEEQQKVKSLLQETKNSEDDYDDLCEKLSKSSQEIFLKKESEVTVISPLSDVVLKNPERVNLLHDLIQQLFSHVNNRMQVLENVMNEHFDQN